MGRRGHLRADLIEGALAQQAGRGAIVETRVETLKPGLGDLAAVDGGEQPR